MPVHTTVYMTRFGGLGSMLFLLRFAGRWLKPKWQAPVSYQETEASYSFFLFPPSPSRTVLRYPHGGFGVLFRGVFERRKSLSDACMAMELQACIPKLLQLQEGSRGHAHEAEKRPMHVQTQFFWTFANMLCGASHQKRKENHPGQ